MFKLEKVSIDGFWGRCSANSEFNQDVNIIIGKNGTGKTTFMNILLAVLSVDQEGLLEHEFSEVIVNLIKGRRRKTIKVTKEINGKFPVGMCTYQISKRKYPIRLVPISDRRFPAYYRRDAEQEASEIKEALENIVSMSALSVYRLRHDDDYEVRDKRGARMISPVDYRLKEALQGLTHFQLSLSQKARSVGTQLQKDVLVSILYGEQDVKQGYKFEFEKDKEREDLTSAYAQLSAIDQDVRKKITFHVDYIDNALSRLKQTDTSSEDGINMDSSEWLVTLKSLEALRKSRRIVHLALQAEEQTKLIYEPVHLFLETISSFIQDKNFSFDDDGLTVSNKQGEIKYDKLSSGEKQLLIILIEALLQNKSSHLYLADEPELSLHIEWQRQIIPAIKKLNPNAQVIAATHSPEVASKYRDSILNMREIIDA